MSLPTAILCGGLGTRLYPLTQSRPKALVEVLGEPFIAHQLRLLAENGIQRVVLCVGHHGDQIRDFVGDGSRFGVQADYSIDGPTLLGTAGAIRQALPLLGPAFFVVYGDSYLPCDYQAVARTFATSGKPGLMTVYHNRGSWDRSNVEMNGAEIVAYDKKNRTPRMEFIDYGLGVFRAISFDRVPPDTVVDLALLYADLLADGELSSFIVDQRFYEVGSFQGIKDLEQFLAERKVKQ